MKVTRAILLLLALGLSAYGQGVKVTANKLSGSASAPPSTCQARDVYLQPDGDLYLCASGVFVLSGGGGTTINSTNGQVPYRVNSTTFGDSGIAYSSGMIGIQVTPATAQLEIDSQSTMRPGLKLRALSGTLGSQNVIESYDASGNLTASVSSDGTISGTSLTTRLSTTYIGWASRTTLRSPADGQLTLLNQAENSFSRLNFGGTTSSFLAIKRSATMLQIRLADDSDDAPLSASVITHKAYTVATLPAAGSFTGAIAYVTDANATTRLSTVAGGGANKVIVFSDGTNWLIL